MREDNRGFTFVELVVGMVIFGLIAVAALGFLVTGTKTYGSVNGAMNQRLEAQLAVNQVSEYLIDCNGSVSFKENTLCVISKNNSGKTVTDIFRFDSDDNALYYGAQGEQALVAGDVTGFTIALRPDKSDSVSFAIIRLTTVKRGNELVTERTVALRNRPLNAN